MYLALDLGVNFIDTADVYGNGRSERLVGRLRKARGSSFYIATKAGLGLENNMATEYTYRNLSRFVDRILRNLEVDAIDLLQPHTAPTDVYYSPEVFEALERLVHDGKVRFCGVTAASD